MFRRLSLVLFFGVIAGHRRGLRRCAGDVPARVNEEHALDPGGFLAKHSVPHVLWLYDLCFLCVFCGHLTVLIERTLYYGPDARSYRYTLSNLTRL